MMEQKILVAKLFLGLALGSVAVVASTQLQLLDRATNRRLFWAAECTLLLSRSAVFLIVFVVLRVHPESDLLLYYSQAKAAMGGLVPYRDFASSYAPLFPYSAALALRVWDSPLAILLLSVAIELAALPVWMFVCRRVFGEEITRFATLLYVTSVIPLVNVGLLGQNQVWLMLLLGITFTFLSLNRAFLSGLALGVALVAIKFLALLFAPLAFVTARGRFRWATGMLLLPIIVYAFFWIQKVNVLAPLAVESALRTAGNLPFLVRFFWPAAPSRIFDLLTLCALAAVFFVATRKAWRHVSVQVAIAGSAAVLLVLLIFSKKAYSNYLLTAFFPICVAVAHSGLRRPLLTTALFGIFGTIAVLEPSLWFRWLDQKELREAWVAGLSVDRLCLFLLCEVALLAFYCCYGLAAIRLARGATPER